jgi:hypothetical protein
MAGNVGGTQANSRRWHEGCEAGGEARVNAEQAASRLAPVKNG